MSRIALVIFFLALGVLLQHRVPPRSAHRLNQWVVWVALPAVVLLRLTQVRIDAEMLYPALMPWFAFALAAMSFGAIAWRRGWSRGRAGALILTGGLGNTSFVGFALLEALYGPQTLATGVVADQAGTFLAFSTCGLLLASALAGRDFSVARSLRRIVTFPPFIAICLAMLLHGTAFPARLAQLLDLLAATLAPVALLAVGMQLRLEPRRLRSRAPDLLLGLGFRLVLVPALVAAIWIGGFGLRGELARTIVLESAMAPMIMSGLLAAEFGLEPELAQLMVGIGIPLSIVTVPLWALVLRGT